MAPCSSKKVAVLISKAAVFAAAAAACAGLFWVVCVLLLTRQTCPLLLLMCGVGICSLCLACHAWKKGRRVLSALAMAVFVLAAALGGMALVVVLEP